MGNLEGKQCVITNEEDKNNRKT